MQIPFGRNQGVVHCAQVGPGWRQPATATIATTAAGNAGWASAATATTAAGTAGWAIARWHTAGWDIAHWRIAAVLAAIVPGVHADL